MTKVFVSGSFNVLHAGHVQFLQDAKALGDYLVVSFPPADLLWKLYDKRSMLEDEDKIALIGALEMVDEVVLSTDEDEQLSFRSAFEQCKPDILAVTTDDRYLDVKRSFCLAHGVRLVVMEKTQPKEGQVSSSKVVERMRAPSHVPLRVDFAGGWLDVPRYAIPGEYVVNCAISPTVSLKEWLYRQGAGLGGSGGWSVLNGWDPVKSELGLGVGWQDPAVIAETGACVWRSGTKPVLDFKNTGEFLAGRMAVYDTRIKHDTPGLASVERNFGKIAKAGRVARLGVLQQDITVLAIAVQMSYQLQMEEGMEPLPTIARSLACKYCGGGHGGYAVYLFETPEDRDAAVQACEHLYPVEPYCRTFCKDEQVPWSPAMLERLRRNGLIK
ncbi:MAG: adenylyltransferase/cytidyltransferase family protein [Akkermansia muciniphila]|nr:adenylyltransferase/cytidyltransferase family protein [Akkermansia muciniphila]